MCFSFWYFVALALQNVSRPINRWVFVSLLVAHYVGLVVLVMIDLSMSPQASDLATLWTKAPYSILLFFSFYFLGHGMLWYMFRRNMRMTAEEVEKVPAHT